MRCWPDAARFSRRLVEPSALLASDLPGVGEREGVDARLGLARLHETEDEVGQDGNEERDADQERADELVKRARVARGNHREALLVNDVAVDEDSGGTGKRAGQRVLVGKWEQIGRGRGKWEVDSVWLLDGAEKGSPWEDGGGLDGQSVANDDDSQTLT